MLWLGVLGRRKIAALETAMDEQHKRHQELLQAFRTLEVDMASQVDKLVGIAKRIQGRRGGRPPGQPNGEAEVESEALPFPGGIFSRHG
jgi:hypothetical protein